MKARITNLLFPLFACSATSAFASGSGISDSGGPLVWFFIGFGALVLMFQAVPAMILFYSMLKAVFSSSRSSAISNN